MEELDPNYYDYILKVCSTQVPIIRPNKKVLPLATGTGYSGHKDGNGS